MQRFLAAVPTIACVIALLCLMLGLIAPVIGMEKMWFAFVLAGLVVLAGGYLYERHRLLCVCLEISRRSNEAARLQLEQERRERNQRQS